MTSARLEDGWIRVGYVGPELARVEIGIGDTEPHQWQPAFLNTVGVERVAQVRPTGLGFAQQPQIWMRVNGVPTLIGRLGGEVQRSRRSR